MDLHLLKLLTAEVLVLITIVHLALVMAVPTGRELHPCLAVEDTVVAGRGATEVVIEAITAMEEVDPLLEEVMEAHLAVMGEVPAAGVVAMAAAMILMVTNQAVAMAAAVVAMTMEAAEAVVALVTAAAAVTLVAAEAVEVDSAEVLEAAMEEDLVDTDPAETKSSPTIKSMSLDCQPI